MKRATLDTPTLRLLRLRPVKFRYKQPNATGEKPIQYGLIAEEVAEVFPEMVVRNKDGQLAAQASRMAHMEELFAALQAQARPSQVAMR